MSKTIPMLVRFRMRFGATVLSPLVIGSMASLGCLAEGEEAQQADNELEVDESLEKRRICFEYGDNCPAREDVTRANFGELACSAELVSVNSEPERASEQCCYDITVRNTGYGCPVPGRPLREREQTILADTNAWSQWGQTETEGREALAASELTAEQTRRLAAHWTRAGQYEHASIASFQRHGLELMRWGAPALLVRLAAQAAMDEVTHASLCFKLASQYVQAPVGPGLLPLGSQLTLADSLEKLAVSVFREGCLNESLAAAEAEAAGATAKNPLVMTVLETISRDESNHADLAWRTLAWISSQLGPLAVQKLRQTLALHIEEAQRVLETLVETNQPSQAEQSHGIMSAYRRQHLMLSTLHEVVAPCLEGLLTAVEGNGKSPFWSAAKHRREMQARA